MDNSYMEHTRDTLIEKLKQTYLSGKDEPSNKQIITDTKTDQTGNTLRYNIKLSKTLTLPWIKALYNGYNADPLSCCIRLSILPDHEDFLDEVVPLLKLFSLLVANNANGYERKYLQTSGISLTKFKEEAGSQANNLLNIISKAGVINNPALCLFSYILMTGDVSLFNSITIKDCKEGVDCMSKYLDEQVNTEQVVLLLKRYDDTKAIFQSLIDSLEDGVVSRLSSVQRDAMFMQNEINQLETTYNNKILDLIKENTAVDEMEKSCQQIEDFTKNLELLLTHINSVSELYEKEDWSSRINTLLSNCHSQIDMVISKTDQLAKTIKTAVPSSTVAVQSSIDQLIDSIKDLLKDNMTTRKELERLTKMRSILEKART